MEHLLVLLIELGRWIDRLFLKSLKRAIPDLDHLLRDPRGTLAGGPITIGPAKKYASGFLLSLLAALLGWVVVIVVFVVVAEVNRRPLGQNPHLVVILIVVLTVILVVSFRVVLYLQRGGRMTLTSTGVELAYRKSVVVCPWALFNAAGQPFLPRADRMLLPVAPAAVPLVELRIDDALLARGQRVQTKQLKFKTPTEALLRPLYEVNIADLGGFLLQLGRVLGTRLPEAPVEMFEVPLPPAPAPVLEPPGRDGWMTVRLTRLVFPPFCCDCGTPTNQQQEFQGHAALLRIGRLLSIESGEFARVFIPVCPECRRDNKSRYWRAVLKGIGFGLGMPLGIGLFLALAFQDAHLLWVFIGVGVIGGLIGLAIGHSRGKEASAPVRLERYSPAKGTIAIRFRWREYGSRLLAFLEAQEDLGDPVLPPKAGIFMP